MCVRVSQKTQKSEFCFATNPSGFHSLDEPPEKIQHYRPINDIEQPFLVLNCNYNGEIGQKFDLVITFD